MSRSLVDGTLDASFSGDGRQRTDFVPVGGAGPFEGHDSATAMVLQGDGKVVVAGPTADGQVGVVRYLEDGTPDTSFSGDGKAMFDIAPGVTDVPALALQSNGKIVAIANTAAATNPTVARFSSDGHLDPTLGGNGVVSIDGIDRLKGVATAGSKIVVAGESSDDVATVIRLDASGVPDTSFAGDGRKAVNFGGSAASFASVVVVQPDGKILVGGHPMNDNHAYLVARLRSDGTLDPAFSGDGIGSVPSAASFATTEGLALRPDGRIVATGGDQVFEVARFTSDGEPDTTFSGDGLQSETFGSFAPDTKASAIAVDGNGRTVVVGSTGLAYEFTIAAFGNDGTLDTTFASGGRQTVPVQDGENQAAGIALQGDGKIVVGANVGGVNPDVGVARFGANGGLDMTFASSGSTVRQSASLDQAFDTSVADDGRVVVAGLVTGGTPTAGTFGLLAFNPDGSPDTTFGGDGVVQTSLPGFNASARGVIAMDSSVIATGGASFGGSGTAVVRYDDAGQLDTTFSGDGIFTDGTFSAGQAIARQADGKIVVAGGSTTGFGVLRLNTDGTLDTSFNTDGKATFNLGGAGVVDRVLIQSDGKLVVTGAGGGDRVVARLTTGGALDTTFSGDGVQTLTFPTSVVSGSGAGAGAAIDASGRVVVASDGGSLYVSRLTTAGELDPAFSSDGTTNFEKFAPHGVALQGNRIIIAGTSDRKELALLAIDGGNRTDTTAPQTYVARGPSGETRFTAPTFRFTSDEDATFECRLDGGSFTGCPASFTTPALTPGPHTLQVRATDVAGNVEVTPTVRAFTVRADTEPPSVSVTTPAEGQHFTQGQTANAVFSCDDGAGSGVVSCSGPSTVDTSVAGNRDFTVNTTDLAGNGTSRTVRYVVDAPPDTQAPSITVTAPSEGQHFARGATVSSVLACDDGGGSGVASCNGPATVDTSVVGARSFTVNATDVAGNSSSKTVGYVVDPPPATQTGTAGSGGSTTPAPPSAGVGGGAPAVTPPPSSGDSMDSPPAGSSGGGSAVSLPKRAVSASRSGVFRLALECSGKSRCRGTVSLTVKTRVRSKKTKRTRTKTVTVGKAVYSLAAGKSGAVKVKLNATGRRLLKRTSRLKVTLTAKPSSSADRTLRRTVTVKRAKTDTKEKAKR